MCGICGAMAPASSDRVSRFVERATHAIAHRGPDGEGFWRWAGDDASLVTADGLAASPSLVALGHRRLSIVDLAGGDQPMLSDDGLVSVVFNGEIYNHLDLRRELEGAGRTFHSRSDTEVLVHGWEEWGEALFPRLNGIFALAIADRRRGVVVLCRDPLGVKPLFVGQDGEMSWWSSELGDVATHLRSAPRISTDALKLFLGFRFVPSPFTIYENVWKLPPSHYCVIRAGSKQPIDPSQFRQYASAIRSSFQPRTTAQWESAIMDELEASIDRQLMADVPLASLLSGGVDSSFVTSIMRGRLPYAPKTFGIGFTSDGDQSEAIDAAFAAGVLGVPHETLHVDDAEYVAAWPAAIRQLSEPIANSSGLLVRLLSAAVRREHKVVLTGQGADEPLGGYPRHAAERLYQIARRAPGAAAWLAGHAYGAARAERFRRVLRESDRTDRYATILSVVPEDVVDRLVPGGASMRELARTVIHPWVGQFDGPPDAVNELLFVDARLSLADDLLIVADHYSMRESVELRVPFLDLAFVDLAWRMPSRLKISRLGARKWLYRRGAVRRLPPALQKRMSSLSQRFGRKRGFTTPIDRWFVASSGPLADTRSWAPSLHAVAAFSGAALTGQLERELNPDAARQRAALYALSEWLNR